MKISSLQIKTLNFPLKKSFATNTCAIYSTDAIALFLNEEGNIGNSFIHVLGSMPCQAIIYEIKKIHVAAIIHSALDSLEKWKKFWFNYQLKLNDKIEIYALAALDIAAWDLFAKVEQKPLHKLLNHQSSDSVRIYGTTGWLSLNEKELIDECEKYARLGINGFKIRLGRPDDFQRVSAVRKAMGDDYLLMLDATQQFSVTSAIEISKKMAELNITWFEEPVGNVINDLVAVKHGSTIPIAAGENIFSVSDFDEVCKTGAVDILQPDIIRCGGITGFIEIAKKIELYHLLLCNHLLPELSISIIAAFSNCYFLEYDDLLPSDIFTESFTIQNGCMQVPMSIGTGVTLNDAVIQSYEIK